MENTLSNTQHSTSSSVRHRKSIFASQKSKIDNQQPKLLVNGQTLTDWQPAKSSTAPNFFQKSSNPENQINSFVQSKFEPNPMKRSFHLPERSASKVIISGPSQTRCIRPASLGKQSVIFNTHQIIQKPIPVICSQAIPMQKQVLASSIMVPSQSSNILNSQSSNLTKTSGLKRKCILVQGKPRESVIFPQTQIRQQPVQIIRQIRPEVNRIIIQDDPKTISQLNKLSSLNHFLTQQYTLINNQLIEIKNKTCQKQIVEEKAFLQKSMNRIDDIFIRQTNEALFKLDQISRCSSSKGFSRTSNSCFKRNPSPTFNKSKNFLSGQGAFTPIKVVEQMQNSSYIECPHHDQLQ